MNYYEKYAKEMEMDPDIKKMISDIKYRMKNDAFKAVPTKDNYTTSNTDISSIVENFSTTTLIKRIFDRIFGLDCSLTTVNQDNEEQYVVFKFSLSSYDVSFKEVAKLIQFSSLYPRVGNKFLQIIEDEETRRPTFTFLVHRDDFKNRKNANNETI